MYLALAIIHISHDNILLCKVIAEIWEHRSRAKKKYDGARNELSDDVNIIRNDGQNYKNKTNGKFCFQILLNESII